jgi:hypothetical protein
MLTFLDMNLKRDDFYFFIFYKKILMEEILLETIKCIKNICNSVYCDCQIHLTNIDHSLIKEINLYSILKKIN